MAGLRCSYDIRLLLHEITAALTTRPAVPDPAENLFVETVLNATCAWRLRNYAEVRHPLSGPLRLTSDQLSEAINYIQENLEGIGPSLAAHSALRRCSL